MPSQAKAGSVVAMAGRLRHTSGGNVSKDRERPLLFGHYSAAFIRGETNCNAALRPEVEDRLSPEMREWLGIEEKANTKLSARPFGTA